MSPHLVYGDLVVLIANDRAWQVQDKGGNIIKTDSTSKVSGAHQSQTPFAGGHFPPSS
jgi:hypothetical protein